MLLSAVQMLIAPLRRSIFRTETIDATKDGQYILAYQRHFVAFRILDGFAEINFTHRSHIWQPCCLSTFSSQPVQRLSDKGLWIVNPALLDGIFQICSSLQPPATLEADLSGGSCNPISPTAFELADAAANGESLSLVQLTPSDVQVRISLFECACCDFRSLLCLCPGLWCLLPSPFSSLERDCEWRTAMSKARATLSKIASFLSHQLPIVGTDALARVDKRLRVYIHYLRKHIANILKDPESVHQVLNPCDTNIAKRPWEFNLLTMRRRWSSLACVEVDQGMGDDLNGADVLGGSIFGSEVRIFSAVTGEQILTCHIPAGWEDDCSFVDVVRTTASEFWGTPLFAIAVLDQQGLLPDEATWQDLGHPSKVQVVKKPTTLEHTEEIFEAVASCDVERAKDLLKKGQDPNCVLVESILTKATQHRSVALVNLLLKGGANVNFVPPHSLGPLHAAVIEDADGCASLLLRKQANPNLLENRRARNSPLHYAVLYNDVGFVSQLLQHGANPLLQNAYYHSGFTLASDGLVTTMCIEAIEGDVAPSLILQRHVSALVECGCPPGLWATAKALQEQRARFRDVLGGASHEKKARTSLVSPDHNRRIALNLRALRLEGRLVAPTTSQSRCPNFFCLRDFNLHTLLPLTLQEGFLQRSIMPQKSAAWPCNSPEVLDHLQLLHPHPRDQWLTFQADVHVYFWNGRKVSLSATGLIHKFSHVFDPNSTIEQMRRGSNWPRARYLKSYVPISLWLGLQELGYTEHLMAMLSARPRPEVDICHLLRRLIQEHPADAKKFLELAKSDAQIKQQWALAADVGSSQGTWMHASFECLLNGGYVSTHDQEIDLFLSFLRQVEPLGAKVYRTEWTIYASKEDLAGSIDLVLQLPDQRLILVDWKRTQQIWTKANGFGKSMRGCLAALPDATLSHYRLQLNIYRYILEAYYGKQVAKMLVVGCHPDNGTLPFVEAVPHLSEETKALMKRLPFKEVDCSGGTSQPVSIASASPPWLQFLRRSCRATLQQQKYALHVAKVNMCTSPRSCTISPSRNMPLKISSFLQEPAHTSKRTSLEPCYISVNLVDETCEYVSAVSRDDVVGGGMDDSQMTPEREDQDTFADDLEREMADVDEDGAEVPAAATSCVAIIHTVVSVALLQTFLHVLVLDLGSMFIVQAPVYKKFT